MPAGETFRFDLEVIGALQPAWDAVEVRAVAPPAGSPLLAATKTVVVAIDGQPPSKFFSGRQQVGATISAGTKVRLAWNVARIAGVKSASALQTFCIQDYFRVKAPIVVVDGPAGTGKSWVLKKLRKGILARKIPLVCVGPTGLVARAMPSGMWRNKIYPAQTVAMFLKHPPTSDSKIKALHVIIDEYVMVSSRDLEAVWKAALSLCPSCRMTLVGDHAQLWPVSGMPPWASQMLRDAQDHGRVAVWRLTAQKRFGECKRMLDLMQALRSRDMPVIEEEMIRLASRPAPGSGACRLIAATNSRAAPANLRVHKALLTHEGSACTMFEASSARGGSISFCNGERVRVCMNKWESHKDGGLKRYVYCNGQEGIVQNLPGGAVQVKRDTRITIRLLDGSGVETLDIEPRTVVAAPAPESEPPAKKRRRQATTWTFVDVLKPSSGQTVHTVQGSTFALNESCIVDLEGFPESILGYHMLIVALSRVRRISNLFVLNYDPDKLQRLVAACGCGCVKRGYHALAHNQSRLQAYTEHLDALKANTRAVFQ